MAFIAKNGLSPLPDDKFCCGVKAHHSSVLKAVANPVNEKTRWDADGPNGPETEPNSMSLLLGWWSTEGNYCKSRGGKDQTGKTKEAYWQMLSQLIKDKGILVVKIRCPFFTSLTRLCVIVHPSNLWHYQKI